MRGLRAFQNYYLKDYAGRELSGIKGKGWSINMYRIGIDLGGTNIKAGVVNDRYEIVASAWCKKPGCPVRPRKF